MNELQHISEKDHGPVLVTLNPPFEPKTDLVAGRYKYEHPVLDSAAISAQKKMKTIQHVRGISFAGAWLKYGFHEDGFTSGLHAAVGIVQGDSNLAGTIRPPFEISPADREPEVPHVATLFDLLEGTGLRVCLAYSLSFCLSVVRWAFCTFLGLDLSHVDRP
ncbi:hypothetical protein QCA50_019305 [Cerrena zonata]|uniref:Uncharacterized protein n=1 Tax=Cerrena zonata TaxID=2478898 RepID=A0AAW0F9Q4_9APHY